MLRVGVLVSGGGTNLQAILDAIDAGTITQCEGCEVVISNNRGRICLGARKKARDRGRMHVPEGVMRAERNLMRRLSGERSDSYHLDLIVLAGYLVKIPAAMIEKYRT